MRTFRAGRNYYYVRLLRWGATQIGAGIGLAFSVGFAAAMVEGINRVVPEAPVAAASASPSPSPSASPGTPDRVSGEEAWRRIASRIASRIPPQGRSFVRNWVVPLLLLLEFFAIAAFLLSLPLTFALAKLEFEQHWYIVTDRSLRIRTGVLSLSESTMSFANLQQVEVKQGPLQRWLGLADVRVRSAGGGDHGDEEGTPLHTGVFHGVDNAEEIRDLILARLKAFREAGLGDPDRVSTAEVAADEAHGVSAEMLDAAREVLRQARALRATTASQTWRGSREKTTYGPP